MKFKQVKIEDVADVTKLAGFEFTKYIKYNETGEIIALRAINIRNNTLDLTDIKRINKSVSESLIRSKLYKDDIILTYTGNGAGAAAIIDENDKYHLAPNICKITPKEINPYYLYKYITSNKFQKEISNNIGGSGQPTIPMKTIRVLPISVPSRCNQTKIAKILKNIDDKIKLNNEINNNLYEMGDNLYNEYFGKYKDNLPSDYKIVKLNEVADNYDSKRKPMSSREREQHRGIYPYYGATSIIDYVDDYIFDDIYLLMGEDGTVKTNDGYPVLQYIWGKNWINNHAHVLKGKNISTELLMFALRKINIESIITGAVQPKINQENMNKIEFVIGSYSKNKELEDILKILMDKSKNIIEENKKLEELRDTLLPKLMNGEIDLDNIEI